MKTKQIPAVIMLAAGLVTSVAGVINHMEAVQFLKILAVVLVVFYIAGCAAKLILDKNFKEEGKEATEEAVEKTAETDEAEEESTEEEQK